VNEVLNFFMKVAEQLARKYIDGEIDLADFQIGFRTMLRRLYTTMVIAGKGGARPSDIDPSKFLEMGNVLRSQYRYLERFMRVVGAGELSEDQIINRARMYVDASEQMFWRAFSDVQLPAYPRDGTSECAMHCACSWELDYTVDSLGHRTHLLATWELGATEHCPTCVQRAAAWNPLVIPLGV
jgi:hypothetical protein